MIWINPIAAIGLVALAAPVLIHILARQRAPQLPFPTLRFIRPFQLAAIKRRALEDRALLAVRALILAAAVAAVAGPYVVTTARQRAWNARTIRAEVTGPLRTEVARAIAWLDGQPPGRREIVVRSALTIGSVTAADVQAVPAPIGLRFERTETPPSTRSFDLNPVLAGGRLVGREVTLDGERTSVRERPAAGVVPLPIEVLAPPDQLSAASALMTSFSEGRVPAPADGHAARVVFGNLAQPSALRTPWMVDAAARIARAAPPRARLAFGSADGRLLVIAPGTLPDPTASSIIRSVIDALAPAIEKPTEEILPIPDAMLRAWTREPGPAEPPHAGTIERDDRRWLWAIVLLLLAAEVWLRRSRTPRTIEEETARVA